eukprot:5080832-Pleurochrysis_carterae.AAC.1
MNTAAAAAAAGLSPAPLPLGVVYLLKRSPQSLCCSSFFPLSAQLFCCTSIHPAATRSSRSQPHIFSCGPALLDTARRSSTPLETCRVSLSPQSAHFPRGDEGRRAEGAPRHLGPQCARRSQRAHQPHRDGQHHRGGRDQAGRRHKSDGVEAAPVEHREVRATDARLSADGGHDDNGCGLEQVGGVVAARKVAPQPLAQEELGWHHRDRRGGLLHALVLLHARGRRRRQGQGEPGRTLHRAAER